MKEFLSTLNWVDYVIIAAFVRGGYAGFREGIYAEIFRVIIYAASSVGAIQLAPILAPAVQEYLSFDKDLATTIAMILIGLSLFLLLRITGLVLLKILKGDGIVYKLLGLVAGIGRWAVILSALFLVIKTATITVLYEDIAEKSRFAKPIVPIAPTMYEYVTSLMPTLPALSPVPELPEAAELPQS